MRFSFEKDIARYHSAWNKVKTDIIRKESNNADSINLDIYGFYCCGKNEFAHQLVTKYKDIYYFSFMGMDGKAALTAFSHVFLDGELYDNWGYALSALYNRLKNGCYLFLMDDIDDSDAYQEFHQALADSEYPKTILFRTIKTTAPSPKSLQGYIAPRSIADYIRMFPQYKKEDVIRLYGLTGGIPAIVKELDANLPYEDNLSLLLRHDSAFSNMLPDILEKSFRSPESYHPIMHSIAVGKHRLSEIAKAVYFPNNKCGKYLESLIKAGLVKAEKVTGNYHTRYSLVNSYLYSWYLYVYRNKNIQITHPQLLYEKVIKTVDHFVAIPALHDSCERYLCNEGHETPYGLFDHYVRGFSKPKRLRHKDGFIVKFDCVIEHNKWILLGAFPKTLDERYTKDEMDYYIKAAQSYGRMGNDVSLFVFSVNRFSDWCVHQASLFKQLHCVTAERLKY